MEIPKNIYEAVTALKILLEKADQLNEFLELEENKALANSHHSLGRILRNEWGLWSDSDLAKSFNEIGVYHADDMSSIIIRSLHRILTKKEVKFKEQVRIFQKYWKNMKKREEELAKEEEELAKEEEKLAKVEEELAKGEEELAKEEEELAKEEDLPT